MVNSNSLEPKLRVLPLGGLGEIGKNMMVLESGDDIVVIDAGVLFPETDMPGVDVVIPNMDYLVENSDRVRALLITHGHEDHIGAVPHLIDALSVPVYAPPMALELIRNKLKQAHLLDAADLRVARAGQPVQIGELTVEWFHVCHSIPDANGIVLQTPLGTVVHSGDFKIDHDPMIGDPTDFSRLTELSGDGVFLLLADSTYAEEEGYTASDRVVADGLHRLIAEAPSRVIVSSFASQIARIQIVADAAAANGRKLAIVGRSMINNTRVARELGHLDMPADTLITTAEAESLPDAQVIIITTGSQGEPSSGLVRMSRGEHREVTIREGDTVIVSASTIPGNEVAVNESIDNLVRLGARVITNRHAEVHVPGHARRDELRMIFNITRPQYFVPVHGEYRMLKANADLAVDQGVRPESSMLLLDGDLLELTADRAEVVEQLPAGHVFVHGLGMWDESGNVVVERRSLSRDGIVTVALARATKSGRLVGDPKIISTGFVHTEDAEGLFADATEELTAVLDRALAEPLEWDELENLVRTSLGRFLGRRTRRHPLIVTVAIDV